MAFLPEQIERKYTLLLGLVWLVIVSAAFSYCHMHGWINPDMPDVPNGANIWLLSRWMFWPVILPVVFGLLAWFSKRGQSWVGLGASALVSAILAALYENGINNLMGFEEGFLGTFYYMVPITLGTYTLFVMTSLVYVRKQQGQLFTARDEEQTLVVNKGRTIVWLKASEVDWMQAARNYVDVHAGGQTYILRNTLSKMEKTLEGDRFIRIHRSYVVNKAAIEGINKNRDGSALVKMKDGSELPCGRAHREALSPVLSTAS